MSKAFGPIAGSVGFPDVGAVSVESPRSEQLQALGNHFDNELIWQVASSDARVVVYSENVHGGLEQVSLV